MNKNKKALAFAISFVFLFLAAFFMHEANKPIMITLPKREW